MNAVLDTDRKIWGVQTKSCNESVELSGSSLIWESSWAWEVWRKKGQELERSQWRWDVVEKKNGFCHSFVLNLSLASMPLLRQQISPNAGSWSPECNLLLLQTFLTSSFPFLELSEVSKHASCLFGVITPCMPLSASTSALCLPT